MELDLRVRLFDWVLQRTGAVRIAGKTHEQIAQTRTRPLPRNSLTNALLGKVPQSVEPAAVKVPTRQGEVGARTYTPPGTAPAGNRSVILYFHGGGFVFGDLDLSDWVCGSVASGTGAVVVSVDYRLAPESPYPAGPQDAYDATEWVVRNADELGVRGDRLAVAGDSAGGTLAAVVSLMARDAGGPEILQQTLIYPSTDLTLGSPSLAERADGPILTLADIEAYYAAYLAGADPREPYASPLFADDLSGLPPALIITAEHDPVRDDGRRYAEALRAAGVPVRHTEYVGMPHGIVSFPGLCRAAPQVMSEVCAELRRALS